MKKLYFFKHFSLITSFLFGFHFKQKGFYFSFSKTYNLIFLRDEYAMHWYFLYNFEKKIDKRCFLRNIELKF